MPLRPGIARIVDEAHAAGVRLGVCTTSDPKSIDGVLDLFGRERKEWFEIVLAGDIVKKKKPDPEIYDLAKQKLGLDAQRLRRRRGQPQRPARVARRRHADADHDEHVHARTRTSRAPRRVVPELGDAPKVLVTLEGPEGDRWQRAARPRPATQET